MNCRQFTALLDDYLEDELPPIEAAAFKAHLSNCSDCAAYLASYRKTIGLAKEAGREDDPPTGTSDVTRLSDEIVRRLLEAKLTICFGWRAFALG
jgi:anti-sigma factor RsiW